MKEVIIKTLEENKLYDDNYDEVYVNKIRDFFDSYHINKSSKNKLPHTIKRDNNGFLVLDNEPYIISDLKTDGHSEAFWMLLSNGSRVLLKQADYEEIQNELLFKYLCKWLDIPCANNDVALFEGDVYLLSPSFLALDEFLLDYYEVRKKTNIDVKDLIDKASKINQGTFVRKALLMDILTDNQDRFPKNFKVIKGKKNIRICPLYDNGMLRECKKWSSVLLFAGESTDNFDIISYLIKDKFFKNWCLSKLISRKYPNLKEEIFKEKGIYVDDEISKAFNKDVKDGISLVLDGIKNN